MLNVSNSPKQDPLNTGNRMNGAQGSDSITLTERTVVVGILEHADLETLIKCLEDGRLDKRLPGVGIAQMVDVSQGTVKHFEGPVHVHTAHVIQNLREVMSDFKGRNEFDDTTFDHVDLLGALIHDVEKATTAKLHGNGHISFPGHEEKSEAVARTTAALFNLSEADEEKLLFIVTKHGKAHDFHKISEQERKELVTNPYWSNLLALQVADARSCYLNPEGDHTLEEKTSDFITLRNSLLKEKTS